MEVESQQEDRVLAFAGKRFDTEPDCPFRRLPGKRVLRHASSGKWYALFLEANPLVFHLSGSSPVPVMNVRIKDPVSQSVLVQQNGIYPAYHMNKAGWISVLLDGSVEDRTVFSLLEDSFFATADPKEVKAYRPPRAFVLPAKVSLADPRRFFDTTDKITWTQSSPSFKAGDIVCIYAGAPISAILYECRILETDVAPDAGMEAAFPGRKVIRLLLLKRFPDDAFPKSYLAAKYQITNIRGPRYLPDSLIREMEGKR